MQSELAEMKSASSPITIKYSFLHLLSIILYFLSNTAKSNAFHSIIQLPSSGLSRNSNNQKTVVLNIDKFGARGDGITDDSKVKILYFPSVSNEHHIFSAFSISFVLYLRRVCLSVL